MPWPSSLDSALSQPLETAACRCFFKKFPLQKRTAFFFLLTSYHLLACLIPKISFPSTKKKPKKPNPPIPARKIRKMSGSFSPCSSFPAWSIPGTHAHSEHSFGWIRTQGMMWWLVFLGLFFFSSKGPRAEVMSPGPRQGHNQSVHESMWEQPLDFSTIPAEEIGVAVIYSWLWLSTQVICEVGTSKGTCKP